MLLISLLVTDLFVVCLPSQLLVAAMPPNRHRLSDEEQTDLDALFTDGLTIAEINRLKPHLSKSRITRKRHNWLTTGHVELTPDDYAGGRPPALTDEIVTDLERLLVDEPDLYLDELVEYLEIQWGRSVSESTVCRRLQERGLKLKVMSRVAGQRDEEQRSHWRDDVQRYRADQLVFVDECAASERNLIRKKGRFVSGAPPAERSGRRISPRYSVLPAITLDGWLSDPVILQESITAEIFEEWLEEKVMPQTTPYPGPRSVIVMDNHSIHRIEVSKKYAE